MAPELPVNWQGVLVLDPDWCHPDHEHGYDGLIPLEILSVVRNLKIIGIFMRLAARDNKKKYKKMIPYAWQMINYRMKNNIEFKNLKSLLKSNFPKFIN